jgi:hypothetical protein
MHCFKRLIASVLIVSTNLMGLPLTAHAALVGTEEALTSTVAAADRDKVDAFMQREDVRAALQARGVSPEAASERVRALSQDEVSQLALHIDQAPAAGADVLGFFLVVFVVLLITDVLGMTKVFPFTRTMR